MMSRKTKMKHEVSFEINPNQNQPRNLQVKLNQSYMVPTRRPLWKNTTVALGFNV